MKLLLVFCLGLFLLVDPLPNKMNAEGMNLDDLLIPETNARNNQAEDNQKLAKQTQERSNIDGLLGPKDNFPFLPDNHRDSGSGKFNSF